MKQFAFLAALVLMTGCKDIKETFVRTSATGDVVKKQYSIPIYERQCTTETVYGPDSSCGRDIGGEWDYRRCVDNCDESSSSISSCVSSCDSSVGYRSCDHLATSCSKVQVGAWPFGVKVIFDSKADLRGNQKEKVTVSGSLRGSILKGSIKVSSDYYKYSYPQNFQVDLSKNSNMTIQFKMVGAK